MLEITEELLEQMRNNQEPDDGSVGNVDTNDLENDLFPIWERDLRPDMIITSYRIAKQIIDLYRGVDMGVARHGDMRCTVIPFVAPFPTALIVVPSSLCHGEYFILDSERPDDMDSQAYRKNLVE